MVVYAITFVCDKRKSSTTETADIYGLCEMEGRGGGWRFFFNDTATTEIYTLSLHDALPICSKKKPQ